MIESPLARLTDEQIEELGKEFDAIHDEVYDDLGDRDRRYIVSMIEMHRRLAVLGRVLLLFSRHRPTWIAGTTANSLAKILENMEIGHNVLHGQWDWMNDPYIHSSSWDWDTASTSEAWKHSHNYVHHTYTNIRGKDKDLGYEIMRIDPHQKWHPVYLAQPVYNVLLMLFFEWGVAFHDLDFEAIRTGEKSQKQVLKELKGIAGKARSQIVKDYVAWPLISALAMAALDIARERAGARQEAPPAQARPAPDRGRGRRDRPEERRARVPQDPHRERRGEHGPQRLVVRDHLLRPLPRPDLHLQPGGGRGRVARRLVRAPARGGREHRGQPALPRGERQPRLPGRAPPVPGHAEHALRGDRAADQGDLRALRAAVQHAARSASSSAWCSGRSCGWRSPAGSRGRSPAPTRAATRTRSPPPEGVRSARPTGANGSGPEQPDEGVRFSMPDR